MPRYRFFTSQDICVEVVEPHGDSKGNALILLGMPATIGETAITATLTSHGWTTLQPHYHGTYDSGGLFSPASAADTVRSVTRAVEAGEVIDVKSNQTRNIAPAVSLVVGYSFGAHVAFRTLAEFNDLKAVLLLSPAIAYGDGSTGFSSEGVDFLDYLSRSRPYTYRLADKSEWQRFYSGLDNSFPAKADSTAEPITIMAYVGSKDESIDADRLAVGLTALVADVLGVGTTCSVKVVQGAGHSSGDLLTDQIRSEIGALR